MQGQAQRRSFLPRTVSSRVLLPIITHVTRAAEHVFTGDSVTRRYSASRCSIAALRFFYFHGCCNLTPPGQVPTDHPGKCPGKVPRGHEDPGRPSGQQSRSHGTPYLRVLFPQTETNTQWLVSIRIKKQ